METYEDVVEKLGGKLAPPGINWRWTAFPDVKSAESFIKWLEDNDYDHRGIYPPTRPGETTYDVRFRPF